MKASSATFRRSHSHWRRRCFRYHSEIGWWHISNLQARLGLGKTFHILRTNSLGMRTDREYPARKPKGRTRILALGDSYAAGDGVSNGLRATDLLEGRNPHLDVMNFGLNGSGTDQQLLIFERMAKPFQADAYIWFLCVENIARNKYHCFPSYSYDEHLDVFVPKPYFEIHGGNLALRNVPVPHERRVPAELGNWDYRFPYLTEYPDDAYAVYRNEQSEHWQLMRAIILRLLKQVRGKPVFLVPLPMDLHYLGQCPQSYWPRFQSLERRSKKVYVLDVLPALSYQSMEVRRNFRFEGDPHYTALAHSVLADSLEYQLRRLEPDLFRRPA